MWPVGYFRAMQWNIQTYQHHIRNAKSPFGCTLSALEIENLASDLRVQDKSNAIEEDEYIMRRRSGKIETFPQFSEDPLWWCPSYSIFLPKLPFFDGARLLTVEDITSKAKFYQDGVRPVWCHCDTARSYSMINQRFRFLSKVRNHSPPFKY